MTLLLVAALGSLGFAAWLAARFDLGPWGFWGIFFGVVGISTMLCNRLVTDSRAMRIEHHNDNAVTFSFTHGEYAREFALLNEQVAPAPGVTR